MEIDRIQFYKEFYFKELSRRVELDNALNLQIIILSFVVTLNIYYIKGCGCTPALFALVGLSASIFYFGSIGLYKFSKSYFNLGKAYVYSELGSMNDYYIYDKSEKKAEPFETFIERKLAEATGHNATVNKKRTLDLADGKKQLFITIALSFVTTIVYIVTLFLKP